MSKGILYQCLCCGYQDRVEGKKEDYSEVKVCPKCNGAFIDIWKLDKYQVGEQIEKPFLSIEMDKMSGAPKVIVNGKLIDNIVHLGIDWSTNNNLQSLKSISISHYESTGILKTVTYENEITIG